MSIIKRCVLLVDPRNRVREDDSNVISRHIKYAQALSKASKGEIGAVVILQPHYAGGQAFVQVSENLYMVRSKTPLHGIFFSAKRAVLKLSEYEFTPAVLIAGDPDISFFSTRLIQRYISKKSDKQIPIQIQVHSELTRQYARTGFVQFFKYIYAKYSLKLADRVRATSEQHSRNLLANFHVPSLKIDVIPVLLSIDLEKVSTYAVNRPRSIGFVGRLQSERNLDLFIKIVKLLEEKISDLNVVVVGDGKDRKSMESSLLKFLDKSRLSFLGNLDQNGMDSAWGKIGVLLSTAGNESYGRAIRESLCYGIPVLAHESLGVTSLLEESSSNWISVIRFPVNEEEIVGRFENLVNLKTGDAYLEFQKHRQSTLADEMAESWLKMTR